MLKLEEQNIVRFGPNIIRGNIYLSRMAKDYIEYNLDMGYTLGLSVNSIDTFAKERQDVLEKLDLFYLFFNNVNFGTVNLIDPTLYKGTAFGGLTWTVDGVQGNGVNGYINTLFNTSLLVPNQKFQLNDASRGANVVAEHGSETTGYVLDGSVSPLTNVMYLGLNVHKRLNNSISLSQEIDFTGLGLKCLSRFDDNSLICVNKNIIDNINIVSNNLSTGILIYRNNSLYGNSKINMYFVGGALTYEETQLLRTSFNKLLKSNGLTESA